MPLVVDARMELEPELESENTYDDLIRARAVNLIADLEGPASTASDFRSAFARGRAFPRELAEAGVGADLGPFELWHLSIRREGGGEMGARKVIQDCGSDTVDSETR